MGTQVGASPPSLPPPPLRCRPFPALLSSCGERLLGAAPALFTSRQRPLASVNVGPTGNLSRGWGLWGVPSVIEGTEL